MPTSNRNIDAFLMQQEMHIEPGFALKALGVYLQELDMLQAGAPYASLGIGKRREDTQPRTMHFDAQGAALVTPYTRSGNIPPNSVGVIQLVGVMQSEGGACTWGIRDYADTIQQWSQNPNVEGLLIEANTGGGEAISGQMLNNAIASFGKPTVVLADFLASAGVMGTLSATEIIAAGDMSSIGSIGTYISVNKEILKWYSENVDDIYAEGSTNKNKEFRSLLAGDRAPMVRYASQINDVFTKAVQNHRPLKGDVQDTLSGGLFQAREARRRGLVDGIGNKNYALKRLQYHISAKKH